MVTDEPPPQGLEQPRPAAWIWDGWVRHAAFLDVAGGRGDAARAQSSRTELKAWAPRGQEVCRRVLDGRFLWLMEGTEKGSVPECGEVGGTSAQDPGGPKVPGY